MLSVMSREHELASRSQSRVLKHNMGGSFFSSRESDVQRPEFGPYRSYIYIELEFSRSIITAIAP